MPWEAEEEVETVANPSAGFITWGIYVSDGVTGEPITGALVELLDYDTKVRKYSGYTDTFQVGLTVYHGHCTISNVMVPPEYYVVRLSKSGYDTWEHGYAMHPMGVLGGGTHYLNPSVAPPAEIATGLSVKVSLDPVTGIVPLRVTISGRLIRLDTGAGVVGKTVTVFRRGAGEVEFRAIDVVNTIYGGEYSVVSFISVEGDVEYYVSFAGAPPYTQCSSSIVTVTAKPVPPITESNLYVTALDTDFNPVAGVRCDLDGLVRITNSEGYAEWIKIESKDYRLTMTKSGYKKRVVPTVHLAGIAEMTLTEYMIREEVPPVEVPKWKEVFSKEYPEAKTYKGKCTHEDCAFLVDPLKLITVDWQRWAEEDLPRDVEGQYAAKGTVPLKLKVYTGTEKVLFGLIEYPAVRVESWHHGSGGIILVIAVIIGLVIIVWAFLAWLFQKAEEIPWVLPAVAVGAGALLLIGLLFLLPKVKRRRE